MKTDKNINTSVLNKLLKDIYTNSDNIDKVIEYMKNKKKQVMYYFKNKHTETYIIVSSDKICAIDLLNKTETVKNNTALRFKKLSSDKINFSLISRDRFLTKMKKAKYEPGSAIQSLLNVQLKLNFENKLF